MNTRYDMSHKTGALTVLIEGKTEHVVSYLVWPQYSRNLRFHQNIAASKQLATLKA